MTWLVGSGLTFDVKVQYRAQQDFQTALRRLQGKALCYRPSNKVVILHVEVDTTGFFRLESIDARAKKRREEEELARARQTRMEELHKAR